MHFFAGWNSRFDLPGLEMLVEFDIRDDGDAQLTQVIRLIGQIWIGGYRQYGEKYRRGKSRGKKMLQSAKTKIDL